MIIRRETTTVCLKRADKRLVQTLLFNRSQKFGGNAKFMLAYWRGLDLFVFQELVDGSDGDGSRSTWDTGVRTCHINQIDSGAGNDRGSMNSWDVSSPIYLAQLQGAKSHLRRQSWKKNMFLAIFLILIKNEWVLKQLSTRQRSWWRNHEWTS